MPGDRSEWTDGERGSGTGRREGVWLVMRLTELLTTFKTEPVAPGVGASVPAPAPAPRRSLSLHSQARDPPRARILFPGPLILTKKQSS